MIVFFWLLLASIGLFALLYFRERRSIFISLFALNILVWALAWIVSTGILENNEILRLLAIALAMLLTLAFLSGPFVLLITLYLNGFRILKREGVRFHNFLSLYRTVCSKHPFCHQLFQYSVCLYWIFSVLCHYHQYALYDI